MKRLKAIVWFIENKERDWRADATPQIAAAFRPASKLRLHTARRMRAGANTTMRWSGVGKMRVTHWRVGCRGPRTSTRPRQRAAAEDPHPACGPAALDGLGLQRARRGGRQGGARDARRAPALRAQ